MQVCRKLGRQWRWGMQHRVGLVLAASLLFWLLPDQVGATTVNPSGCAGQQTAACPGTIDRFFDFANIDNRLAYNTTPFYFAFEVDGVAYRNQIGNLYSAVYQSKPAPDGTLVPLNFYYQ